MSENKLIDVDVFNFIYGMAVNDALNRVSAVGDKENLLKNTSIKNELMKYAYDVLTNLAPAQKTKRFNSMVNYCESNSQRDDGSSILNFGKSQKLINMTIKYLFIRFCDSPNLFDDCDAPMDSIMRDFVYKCFSYETDDKPQYDKECAWSKIEESNEIKHTVNDYKSYQNAIDCIIKRHKLNINRIQFDCRYWDRARKLRYTTDEEERTEILDNPLKLERSNI